MRKKSWLSWTRSLTYRVHCLLQTGAQALNSLRDLVKVHSFLGAIALYDKLGSHVWKKKQKPRLEEECLAAFSFSFLFLAKLTKDFHQPYFLSQ
jgi:hypothetical protein